jgi:hypothetical protein
VTQTKLRWEELPLPTWRAALKQEESMRITVLQLAILAGASLPAGAGAQTALTINRFHPGCNAKADPRGDDCLAAAHRFCEANYSHNSFGFPYKRPGEQIYIACAVRGWYGDVPYSHLQQLHPQCRSAADGQSPHCIAAVRRYCANERSLSGGLIQEVGPRSAAVACFEATRYTDVPYRDLALFSPDCKGPGAAGSLGCVTAAAGWCSRSKQGELGLPQEVGPASIAVACMPASLRVLDVSPPTKYDDGR